ncbi:MCE family protein [Nocardia sp. NPDC050630]|uniref:MCE family protein n=1 Tax=Nocardia sp. NPDC050630 TaxID=3364321 RepID=UPI0037B60DB6
MKSFDERNKTVIGAVGIATVFLLVLVSLQYDKIPFFSGTHEYSAEFAELGGLKSGAVVQVSGMSVGKVKSTDLDGQAVRVTFTVDDAVFVGDLSEAAIKTHTVLGAKTLEITPRGTAALHGAIPRNRTTSPYELSDALGDLTTTISGLDTKQVSDALTTMSDTLRQTAPDLQQTIDSVGRFSDAVTARDGDLRNLLTRAAEMTTVLSRRSDQIVTLIKDANVLLAQLRARSATLARFSSDVSTATKQISGTIADNREQLQPALERLNSVLGILDKHTADIQQSITLLNRYLLSLGESVGSGPYFKAYVANLVPGQWLQPFIDAAFADQGLNPAQLLPSQLTAPEQALPSSQAAPPAAPAPPNLLPPGLLPLGLLPGVPNGGR